MYRCESWTVKRADQRIDAFELWCWKRLLRVPWTARRSTQSILKEISREYSLEGLRLKLKPILWPPDAKNWLIGKDLDAGKIEVRRRKGWQRMRWLDGITNTMDMSWVGSRSWWWTGKPGILQSMGSQRVGHDWATELTDWASPHIWLYPQWKFYFVGKSIQEMTEWIFSPKLNFSITTMYALSFTGPLGQSPCIQKNLLHHTFVGT